MCGIIGYIGKKEAIPILVEGLKRLEYRGYDSAGFCILKENNLKLIKRKGKISEISKIDALKNLKGNIGIAHTRWATHGEPNEINSHPHTCCNNQIAIVHNGIIENYASLKELLLSENHKIISETDSELIAHLIEKFYKNNLKEAITKALKLIEGTFGLAVIHKNGNKIIAARKGSPLILGIGNNEMFVTSDVAAILNHTKKVIYLQDNEIVSFNEKDYSIQDINGEFLEKEIHEVKWNARQIEKKGFKHFLLKEISEQPETLTNAIKGRIKENQIKLSIDLDINSIQKIILTACGTSWHSALVGKYIIESLTNIPVEVDYASEFRYRNPILNEKSLVIVISQSGETADTLAAIKEAKSKNAKTLGIVNVVGSSITREVNSGIYLHAGPEVSVASTKAFTSQILNILLLALFLRQEKGFKLDKNLLKEINELPKKIKLILDSQEKVKAIAKKFKSANNFLYLGRGINFPVALEGALKLKEISYIHSEGYPAAELKHGPIALIDKNMPIIFLVMRGNLFEKSLNNLQEIKARGGKVITITNVNDKKVEELSDHVIKVPETIEELSPIINTIPLQLLAYYIADLKGLDIDKPRNLAKSVTVE